LCLTLTLAWYSSPVPKLSVTIITRNEAANVGAAIESVRWADEVVVVDSGSTDATVEIARGLGARVFRCEWRGYPAQKNFAAEQASHDWVLSLDADERVSPGLAKEIQSLLAAEPAHAAYRLRRVSWYRDRWIYTTDWSRDRPIRLYARGRARWGVRRVHESVAVNGTVGRLGGVLEHRPYRDVSHHLDTMNRYTSLAAAEMFEEGRRSGLGPLLTQPAAAFVRNYVVRRGFLQGSTGFILSSLNAYYVFLKFVKLWELQRSGAGPGGSDPRS